VGGQDLLRKLDNKVAKSNAIYGFIFDL